MITGYGRSTSTSTVTGSLMAGFRLTGQHRRTRRRLRGRFGVEHRRQSAPRRTPAPTRLLLRALLEPVHDLARDRAGVPTVGVDPNRRYLTVERNALGHQGAKLLGGVSTGQQRPTHSAGGTPN